MFYILSLKSELKGSEWGIEPLQKMRAQQDDIL